MKTESETKAAVQQQNDPLPEGTKIATWERADRDWSLAVNGNEDWLDEPPWDELEVDPQPVEKVAIPDPDPEDTVIFEQGDQVPLELVRKHYNGVAENCHFKDGNHKIVSCGFHVPRRGEATHAGPRSRGDSGRPPIMGR